MSNISGVNTRMYYPTLGSGGIIDYVNGSTTQDRQTDVLLNNAKLLSGVSLKNIKNQQSAYRQQLKDFTADAHSLYNTAVKLSRSSDKQTTAQTLSQVKGVLDGYNKLANEFQSAQNISAQGKTMINGIDKIMQSKKDDLAIVGITQNTENGQWQVDDKALANALSSDQTKDKATGILRNLGTTLSQATSEIVKRPSNDYFKSPVYDLAAQLMKNTNKTGYASYSKGIFLDMLA